MQLPVDINCITLLGLGTVGTGIIQIFPHFFKAKKLYVVDRIPGLEEKLRGIIASALPEVQQALSKVEIIPRTIDISPETVRTEIAALVAESQALMDLTTCVDSETMARLAESHSCAYICACIEVFDDDPLLSEGQRHQTWRELKKDLRTTMIIEMGMNPGLVSLLLNRALRDSGIAPAAVHTVHVTEYDSHRLREDRKSPDQFYCTWSPYGLWQEGLMRAEMAWSLENPVPEGWKREGNGSMIVHQALTGVEVQLQSCTPRWTSPNTWEWAKYYGFVLTHGEIETMSYKLDKKIHAAFVFHTSPDATAGLRQYKFDEAPKYTMIYGTDVTESPTEVPADNIGVLVLPRAGPAWWCGSLMQCREAQRVGGPINNGANLTVSAGCAAAIAWALLNPGRGALFPDEIDAVGSEWILKACEPFLGLLVSQQVPEEVRPPMEPTFYFCEPGDLKPDPTQ